MTTIGSPCNPPAGFVTEGVGPSAVRDESRSEGYDLSYSITIVELYGCGIV